MRQHILSVWRGGWLVFELSDWEMFEGWKRVDIVLQPFG